MPYADHGSCDFFFCSGVCISGKELVLLGDNLSWIIDSLGDVPVNDVIVITPVSRQLLSEAAALTSLWNVQHPKRFTWVSYFFAT